MRNLLVWGLIFVCWSTLANALDNPADRLTEVIKEFVVATYPDLSKDDLQVTFKFAERTLAGLKDLSADTTFQVAGVYRDFRPVGSVIFPILVNDGDKDKKIFIRTQVEVLKEVVVASRAIKRGAKITADDLSLQERDVALYPKQYFTSLQPVVESETKTMITQNSTIFSWMVKASPVRHRGDEVSLLVTGENLMVKTRGIILTDGYLGGEVRVRRLGSKEAKDILTGTLISSGDVEVKL